MGKGISFEAPLDGAGLSIGIVVARWNYEYTYSLRDGCIEGLMASGVSRDDITVWEVPGSFELVYGAKRMLDSAKYDAVIVVGCLIKGETAHFEYLAQSTAQGIATLNAVGNVPVIFGVLTCLTEEQARVRSIGEHNHGQGWGKSAIEMARIGTIV